MCVDYRLQVMCLNLILYGEGSTTETKVAVLIMLAGVTLATVTDVDVSAVGFAIGMAAVIGAAQQQIFIGKIQKRLGASANQLLVSYTPFVVVMLASCTPIDMQLPENKEYGFNAYTNWYQNHCTNEAMFIIFFSGCLGLLVSLSTFLMIGATSPLTYNIVGHLKTVSILTMGVLFFGDSVSSKKMMGIGMALTGVIMYSNIKMKNAQKVIKRYIGLAFGPLVWQPLFSYLVVCGLWRCISCAHPHTLPPRPFSLFLARYLRACSFADARLCIGKETVRPCCQCVLPPW